MTYEIILKAVPWRTNRTFLGLGNIVLVKDEGQNILIDVGHYGDRHFLLEALKERLLSPIDINTIILTHLHFDHFLNVDLFKDAKVLVGRKEYEYATTLYSKNGGGEKFKNGLVAEDIFTPTFVKDILNKVNLELVNGNEKITKNVELVNTPGHTPGHMSVLLNNNGERVVVASDAVHFFTELFSKNLIFTYGSPEEGKRSIEYILNNSDIIIPGHDRPCRVKNGRVCYSDVREREWDIKITSYV